MSEQKIIWSKDEGANEVMAVIGSTIADIEREGKASCRKCGVVVYGENVGEILDLLGSHG